MQYRELGKTGRKVSALGFGCMRLPKRKDESRTIDVEASVELLKRAFDLGVNYYDTAYMYDNGDSERTLGEFLKLVPRNQVFVTTKNPVGHQFWPIPGDQSTAALWRRCLEEELERVGVDYFDGYLFHDTTLVMFRTIAMAPKGTMEQARKAKEEGLIRHIGFSSHDTPENIMKIIDMAAEDVELLIVQYNLLDRRNEKVIEYAREKGIGVAVMGPVGGGRLIYPSDVYQKALNAKSTAEAALRFVLANPGVSTAMSGMNAMQQLEENVATASRAEALTAEEKAAIDRLQEENQKLLNLYCTGCRYCMPCPNGVNIPGNFSALNTLKVHGLRDLAFRQYEMLGEGKAENCVHCGECAGKCPQHIDIEAKLEEVAAAFTAGS